MSDGASQNMCVHFVYEPDTHWWSILLLILSKGQCLSCIPDENQNSI